MATCVCTVAGWLPTAAVGRQSAVGHDAVHVGMVFEFLVPRVQHAEEADFGAETPRVAGDLEQGLGAGSKQQIVERLFIGESERRERVRQRENDVEVARRQNLGTPRIEPAMAGVGLALRAVPIAARVIRNGAASAAGAFVDVSAERGRAAAFDGVERLDVRPAQPFAISKRS